MGQESGIGVVPKWQCGKKVLTSTGAGVAYSMGGYSRVCISMYSRFGSTDTVGRFLRLGITLTNDCQETRE
jgi:hypothetical protein